MPTRPPLGVLASGIPTACPAHSGEHPEALGTRYEACQALWGALCNPKRVRHSNSCMVLGLHAALIVAIYEFPVHATYAIPLGQSLIMLFGRDQLSRLADVRLRPLAGAPPTCRTHD